MSKLTWALAAAVVVVGLTIYFAGDTTRGFGKKPHTGTDGDVKYIVFVPGDYTADHPFPVILFLHGAAEGGTNGKKPAVVGLGKAIRDKNEKFPFIAVFPQSQTGGWETNGVEGKWAMAIPDEVQKDYQTDKKRVYLTGLSMAAAGTWSLAAAHPERFAAIAPVCGYSDSTSATRIKGVPIWSFCGDQETAPLLENNGMMAKALMQAGASARFEEYPGVAHNAWDQAYGTAESYTWFLEHSIPALSTVIVSVIPR